MTTPELRDAAAIVLLRRPADPEVFWAERSGGAAFLPGYRAFVGGKVEPGDAAVPCDGMFAGADPRVVEGAATWAIAVGPARSAAEPEPRVGAVAAVRELFEETGVLLAPSPAPLGRDRLAAARRELASGRPFADLLADLGAHVDLAALRPAGRWVTPPFAPRRFDTRFFLAWLPPGQEPAIDRSELVEGAWVRPADAVRAWERAEHLVPPPVLHILRALADGLGPGLDARLDGGPRDRIEFLPGIVLVPLRTETLPPATHTNAYIVGRDEAVVVDPGSARPEEQERLALALAREQAAGVRLREVVLTHHHPDHVAGTDAVRRRFGLPVAAHAETAARLRGTVAVDRVVADGERMPLGGGYALTALHTPGHAAGHLALLEEKTRALLSGDNVVGFGTVLIDPDEGDMDAYLASLARMREVGSKALFGGHGPAVPRPVEAIDRLIGHRLWREAQILASLTAGPRPLDGVVAAAYADTPAGMLPYARRQALAHLARLAASGRVQREVDGSWLLRA